MEAMTHELTPFIDTANVLTLWGKHGSLDQRVESADGPDIGYSKDGVVGIETGYHQTELIPTRFRVESRAKNRRT